jgi:hypothetical protein
MGRGERQKRFVDTVEGLKIREIISNKPKGKIQ